MPRDVIEDVHRLGGFGIVAHPDSPKDDLRWRDWNEPFDGIELVNLDSGWRTRVQETGWGSLVKALGTYPIRPSETIGHLVGESAVAVRTLGIADAAAARGGARRRRRARQGDPG